MSTRYVPKECSVMPGTWWVVDTTKSKISDDYRVEWFETQEEAERDSTAKNAGKTRTCQPRSEETKAKMRESREKRKKERETDGVKHSPTDSKARRKRRSNSIAK